MQLSVLPYIGITSAHSDYGGYWDDEVRDNKVDQIEAGYKLTKSEWPGGESSLPFIVVPEKKPDVDHRKHIITRKRKA